MKLVCSQTDLSQHLALVNRAVASRPTLPILSNVLLEADPENGVLALTGFDMNLGIRTEFPADVTEGGSTTIPARLLSDIVTRLPDAPLSLEQDTPDSPVVLSCFTGQYQLRGLAADDYPSLPDILSAQKVEISVETLLEGISQTIFAASGDETKQILTGIHVKMSPTQIEFAATDGHRLAMVQTLLSEELASDDQPGKLEFTIPARTLKELEKVLNSVAGKSTMLKVQFDQSQVQLGLPNNLITSRLLDGQYPNYQMLIPAQFERQMTVERRALIELLERIAVVAEQKNNIVKFSLRAEDQNLEVSVEAPDVGSARESLTMQLTGSDLEIAFNVKYLLDALKVIPTQSIKLMLNSPTQPVVMQPIGGSLLKYLVMPVQIRS